MQTSTIRRSAAAVLLPLVLALSMYAFTASNTVEASLAGDGAAEISGYTVSDVTYTIVGDDVTQVDFVLGAVSGAYAAPSTMRVQLVDLGAWYTIELEGGCSITVQNASCTVSETTTAVDQLRVIAAQ